MGDQRQAPTADRILVEEHLLYPACLKALAGGAAAFMGLAGSLLYWLLVRPWIGKPEAELSVIMTTIAVVGVSS